MPSSRPARAAARASAQNTPARTPSSSTTSASAPASATAAAAAAAKSQPVTTPNGGTPRGARKRSAQAVVASAEEGDEGKEESSTLSRRAKRSRTSAAPKYTTDSGGEQEQEREQEEESRLVNKRSSPAKKSNPRKPAAAATTVAGGGANGDIPPQSTKDSTKVKAAGTAHDRVAVIDAKTSKSTSGGEAEAGADKKKKAPRKSKAEKEAEAAMPLAARTAGVKMLVGAHVSSAGGVQNAVGNAVHIGGNAFALFLKSQRKWDNPPLKAEQRDGFVAQCAQHKYAADAHVLPHGSYLVNLAQADAAKGAQAYTAFVDDLRRCEALGIRLYNFHPGNTNGQPREEALARLAARLNDAHRATTSVVTLLENMAGAPAGNTLGSTFEDLRAVIEQVADKSRVGVCIDTCHAFAAGYDLRTPAAFAATLAQLDAVVGIKYVRALHINDSKAPLAGHRDLHQNIGLGFLGLRAFHNVVNEPRFHGLPLILETPIDRKDAANGKTVEDKQVWADEIKLLESLVGMDSQSQEFLRLEQDLASKGAAERSKYQLQFDKKLAQQDKKKSNARVRKAGKKKATRDDDDDDEATSED